MKILIRTLRTINSQVPALLAATGLNALLNAVKPFILLYFSAAMIDELFQKVSLEKTIKLAVATSLFLLTADLFSAILNRCRESWFIKLSHAQEAVLCEKVMRMNYKYLEDTQTQIMLENIKQCKFQMGDIFAKEVKLLEKLITGTLTILVALGYTIQLIMIRVPEKNTFMSLSPILLAVVLCILGVVTVFSANNSIKHTTNIFKQFSEVAAINRIFGFYRKNVFQNYRYGKEIRIFGEKELITDEFGHTLNVTKKFIEKVGNEEGRFRVNNTILNTFLSGLAYLFVGLNAYYGVIGVGSIVKYAGAIGQFLNGITDNVRAFTELVGNGKYLKQYLDFLDLKDSEMLGAEQVDTKELEIEFDHVSYQYPNTDKWALEDVSFRISKGEHLAIVGENGSGKTTCIRLLCRLYEPDKGVIRLNGKDIRNYEKRTICK